MARAGWESRGLRHGRGDGCEGRAWGSQQFAKLLRRQARSFGDVAHRDGVDGIVAWYRKGLGSSAQVLAFANDPPAELFEDTDSILVIDARQFRHRPGPRLASPP